MKRILILLLCASMIAPSLFSCSESTDNAETDTSAAQETTAAAAESAAKEEETYLSDNLGDHNFDGYTFRLATSVEEYASRITVDDFTGTPVVDTIRNGTLAIEDRFNVDITWTALGQEVKPFETSINAGDDAYDVQVAPDWVMYPMAQKGMFINLYDIEQFDLSQPWWPEKITQALDINGAMYTAANYMSYQGLHWERALMINKDLAEKLNYEVPYNTVREGKWTLDAMISYVEGAAQDVDGDGVINGAENKDIIGYVTGSQTSYCLQESVGINPYIKDETGRIVVSLDVDKIDSFITKMRAFIASKDYYDAGDFFGNTFRNGTTLLCYGQLGDAYDIYSEEDFKYGFLTAPKYDELQEDYINCCTDTPWALPVTLSEEQFDIVGTVCEALSCYNYQHVLPAYFEVAMKARLADSPDDAEMLQLIADTRTTSFSWAYGLNFKDLLGQLGTNSSGVASFLAKQEKSATKLLDKVLKDFDKIKEDRQ